MKKRVIYMCVYSTTELFAGFRWKNFSYGLRADVVDLMRPTKRIEELIRGVKDTIYLLDTYGEKVLTNDEIDFQKVIKLTSRMRALNSKAYEKKLDRYTCEFISLDKMKKLKILV